jgi:uncharacterized peroxidase-related enzyme
MSRIQVIQYEEAKGKLKEAYDELIAKRGKLFEALKIQSLHPPSITSHTALYMDIMFSQTALTRAEKEMLAVVVSVANGCFYCKEHHGTALNEYWKNEARVQQLKRNYRDAGLSERETAMCDFAVHLTTYPEVHEEKDFTPALKEHGLSDEAVLDVVLVTSYFNFVNRMVMALGVQLEEGGGKGYKY